MKKVIMIVALGVMLSGCSTSQNELLPPGDSSMLELWQKNSGSGTLIQSRADLTRDIAPQAVRSSEQQSYTRTAENEATALFPRLPNPDLVMYVYPHLSPTGEPIPIPGYSTVIPFYGRVQYAQPGERTRDY
ncbi:TIGR03751 family conjugal transfer lipoprotein [Testudinibacter sp. P80/BLE/0925]|uniref:TIGR03751 family conjugal transfer lipoprotein n=1 Tax=Testudinibacter sp. TW-1 TaxID=3417757 RepID=UPI003D361A73